MSTTFDMAFVDALRATGKPIDSKDIPGGVRGIEEIATLAPPFKNREGIQGRIVIEEWPRGAYYGGGTSRTVYFKPTPMGKRSEAYQKTRRELKDDWMIDLSKSEAWGDYMVMAFKKLKLRLA